ncbi:MAG: hypothetical protein KKB50_14805 [Planctomycetes bacterium]|nr:hypothetical protein [Planctomycetota bacterium]
MRAMRNITRWLRLSALAGGGVFLFSGCDPSIQSTLETGIINTATSFLAALLRAVIDIAQEENTTAQIFGEALHGIVA